AVRIQPGRQGAQVTIRGRRVSVRERKEAEHGSALSSEQSIGDCVGDGQGLGGAGASRLDAAEVGVEKRASVERDYTVLVVPQLVGELERSSRELVRLAPASGEPLDLEAMEQHVRACALVPGGLRPVVRVRQQS